jgi:hypothetical protein
LELEIINRPGLPEISAAQKLCQFSPERLLVKEFIMILINPDLATKFILKAPRQLFLPLCEKKNPARRISV